LGLPQNRIIIGNGSNELIELIIRTFFTSGEEIIQAFPTFLVYEKIVTGAGGKIITIPLKNFKINLEAMHGKGRNT
jgi:histidinol-phosphate aminotransferase